PSDCVLNRTHSPFSAISPRSGTSRRLMHLSIVLLPDPEAPMMLITSPSWAETVMPRNTSVRPKRLWRSLTVSAARELGTGGSSVMSDIDRPRQDRRCATHRFSVSQMGRELILDERNRARQQEVDRQVDGSGADEDLHRPERLRNQPMGDSGDFSQCHDAGKRGRLDHENDFVSVDRKRP